MTCELDPGAFTVCPGRFFFFRRGVRGCLPFSDSIIIAENAVAPGAMSVSFFLIASPYLLTPGRIRVEQQRLLTTRTASCCISSSCCSRNKQHNIDRQTSIQTAVPWSTTSTRTARIYKRVYTKRRRTQAHSSNTHPAPCTLRGYGVPGGVLARMRTMFVCICTASSAYQQLL